MAIFQCQLSFPCFEAITNSMISQGSLVVYKNQPARTASCADGRITIELESGETKKVREKDVSLLHPGISARMPSPREGGDFDTAHAMLVAGVEGRKPVPTSWKELSELVFGDFSQESAMACVLYAARGILFRIAEGEPFALSHEELEHISRKSGEKLLESERKASFIAAFRVALRRKEGTGLRETQEYARYISDLESFALGSGERCPIAAEAGVAETREAVHQALLDSDLWPECMNPWPGRAGCSLSSVKLEFPVCDLPPYAAGRTDLTHIVAYAIDNAWSNDPDDAIAVDGDFLWVHVADPAAFIAPDSPVDLEALSRGATLYLPEKTIPMLPVEAVERLGLGLSPESPALSFGMRLSGDGSIAETRITASRVHVERLSYEEADVMLKNSHADLVRLGEFAELRHKRRVANDAVDIDFPEVSIKVDAGLPHFNAVPVTRSAGIVREMMLLAGEAAGRWAWERKIPFVYSSQEAPALPKSLPKFDTGDRLLSQQYQRRKGMRASIIGTEYLAHQGLGLPFYSQVTSPLRRYQDLLAHYQLRAYISAESSGYRGTKPSPLVNDEVARRCLLAGQAAASTRQAERDSRLHWVACFLMKNPDWRGTAVVLDLRDQDIWIVVPELGFETSLRTRKNFSPDDIVDIKVARVSLTLHDISFEPA